MLLDRTKWEGSARMVLPDLCLPRTLVSDGESQVTVAEGTELAGKVESGSCDIPSIAEISWCYREVLDGSWVLRVTQRVTEENVVMICGWEALGLQHQGSHAHCRMGVMQLHPHSSTSQKRALGTVTLPPSNFQPPSASSSTRQGLRAPERVIPWETREALQLARDSVTDGETHTYTEPIAQAMPAHAAAL